MRQIERTSKPAISFFRLIPPERVGLSGEYDHSGLAKRVVFAFEEHFEVSDLEQLRVLQRGRVIILLGRISSWQLLTRLIGVASEVYGASTVETHGLMILDDMKVS